MFTWPKFSREFNQYVDQWSYIKTLSHLFIQFQSKDSYPGAMHIGLHDVLQLSHRRYSSQNNL